MKSMLKTLALLSDETRLRILAVLEGGESCVCEVMKALDITQSSASRGLTALYDAGLLAMRREGAWSLYALNYAGMAPYQQQLVKLILKQLRSEALVADDRNGLVRAQAESPRRLSTAETR